MGKAICSSSPTVVVVGLIVFACRCFAQATDAASSSDALKKLSLQELMDVEVTSVSKRPEKLSDVASAIQVTTADDIRRAGATSVPESLRLAGNLNVAQKSPYDWAVSARGFNANVGDKLLVLMDGRTLYTLLFSGVIWSVQNYLLEDIDRIEVISGPGGTLWGANAVNGVINITTKSASDTQGLYAHAGGGSALNAVAGVRYGGALAPNVHFRVYGEYVDRDHAVITNGDAASDAANIAQGGFRIDAEASSQDRLTVQGDLYGGDENLQGIGTAKVSGGNVLGRWSHRFSAVSHTSLQLYYDRTHLSDPFPASTFAPFGYLKDTLDTYDLDFQHRFELGLRHKIVWGLGYRFTHQVDVAAPNVAFLPAVLDHSLYNGFAQDQISLADDWILTLGTKLEHNGYTGFEFEPNVRLQWNVSSKRTLWAAVSRAVRMPSRFDRDLYEPSPPQIFLAGNTTFESETLIAYELGARAQVGPKVSGSIATFYNDYDRLRSLGLTPVTFLPLIFQNNNKGQTYGFELSATYAVLDWWRLRAAYNLLKEHIWTKAGQVDLYNALNETADPEQQASLRSSMDLIHGVELDAGFRYVDSLLTNDGPTPGGVPSYVDLDVRLGWRFAKSFELSIVGQNLLHDHHPEYGFPGPNRVESERSVYAKVAWRFQRL